LKVEKDANAKIHIARKWTDKHIPFICFAHISILELPNNMHFSKILLSLAAVVGASAAAAVPSPRAFGVATSVPRGGAGPVDADLAMKTYAGICTVQGALDFLSPKTGNKLYGLAVDDGDAVSAYAQSYVGGNQAAVAVALYSSVFMGLDGTQACGWALIPGILNQASSILDGKPQEVGCNVLMQYLNLGIQAFAARAALVGADNASTILAYFSAYVRYVSRHHESICSAG